MKVLANATVRREMDKVSDEGTSPPPWRSSKAATR